MNDAWKMNETNIYRERENMKVSSLKKKKKKEKGYINKRMKEVNGLSEATGIYQRRQRNIHTEFLANDRKFLSLIKCYTTSRVKKYRLLQ